MTSQLLEPARYWSVTFLQKKVLGVGEPIVYSTAEKIAIAALNSRATLDAMEREQGRDAALDWLQRARFASQNVALNRGSDIHVAARQLAIGEPVTIDDALMPYVEQYHGWLERFAPVFLMSEAPVVNHTWRYAGTLDGIMELRGRPLLFDIKTTEHGPNAKTRSGNPKSRPPFPEVALQLVAYAHAEEVVVDARRNDAGAGGGRYYEINPEDRREPMPHVDGALCIVVSPEDCFAVPVRIDDEVWHAWLALLNIAQVLLSRAHPLFGPVLGETLTEQLQASVEALT